jgi:hypothetical protein
MTSVVGNDWVRKLMRQRGSSGSPSQDKCYGERKVNHCRNRYAGEGEIGLLRFDQKVRNRTKTIC